MKCATKTFSGFCLVRFSVCSQPEHDVIEFVYSSFSSPARRWMIQAVYLKERKKYRFNVRCKKTFTFERLKQEDREMERYKKIRAKWPSFSLIKTVIVALHQTSLSFECEIQQLIISRALTNIILNLLVSLLLPLLFWQHAGILMSLFLHRFRLLCDADEAYERISSHLIF